MYIVKTPQFIQCLFPNFVWRLPTEDKVIHLTFDDGPIPDVTPWVLEQLATYDAKATFFCVGDNMRKHPHIAEMVVGQGHAIGNHTFNHLNGWSTDNIPYFHNIRHCAHLVQSDLFRPPYGKMRPTQAQFLQRHYHIVMWDVLSGDFDPHVSPQQCLDNVAQNAAPGSIVVFHDSLKAADKLYYALPYVLDHFTGQGYRFEGIFSDALPALLPAARRA